MTNTAQRLTARRVTLTDDAGQPILQVVTTSGDVIDIEVSSQQLMMIATRPLHGITCPNCKGSGESGKHPDGAGIPCIRCGGTGKA